MTMIALGGVIGAGLFVGSGVVIKAAGPAAVISFAITGCGSAESPPLRRRLRWRLVSTKNCSGDAQRA
jgi:Amino acid permease